MSEDMSKDAARKGIVPIFSFVAVIVVGMALPAFSESADETSAVQDGASNLEVIENKTLAQPASNIN